MAVRPMLDVLVIGAGQAGLAMGYYLQRAGRDFAIVDGMSEIRASWSSRWDSLVLFTPAQSDNPPGLPFPGEEGSYPTKGGGGAYLKAYANACGLPVRTTAPVSKVARDGDRYVATTGGSSLAAG